MRDTYSLHEAKSKLSEIVHQVRKGHPVIVTLRGKPAVESRAVETPATGIDARLKQLTQRGVLLRATGKPAALKRIARRPGALNRFLAERDE